MALKNDLESSVANVFSQNWSETTGRVVPAPSDVPLNNTAVLLEQAVVLYADLDGSTNMVDSKKWEFSAEIYKTFLLCAARIIKSESGDITAYDGDRIMAIFIGENRHDRAARSALKIKWSIGNIITPKLKQFWNTDFELKHTVGIDVSDLRAVRTGVRGDNDLVWVGRAANWAAKLTTLPSNYQTYMTLPVYTGLSNSLKTSTSGKPMWEYTTWTQQNSIPVYRSDWGWIIN